MSDSTTTPSTALSHEPSRIKILQYRLSLATWTITLLLSLRGLFAFYGMKDKGSAEQILAFITDPLVQLFSFDKVEAIGIPGITILFAAISLLLISNLLQTGLWLTELRLARSRHYVFKHAVRSSSSSK